MLGLALEGGGARGAFHIGVMQACLELGMSFDVIAGTSIGALNGAMFAQGDFETAKAVWSQLAAAQLFSPEDEAFLAMVRNKKINAETVAAFHERFAAILAGRGVDTTRMRATFEKYVDVDKLLASPVDFGLVTVSLPDFKPLELFKNQMEKDTVLSYLMASASFPGFEQTFIGNKRYIDGGIYDNCPINMLATRGCDKIVAVRTFAIGVTRALKDRSCQLITITPSDALGNIMHFDPKSAKQNMELGYFDAMRALKGLHGRRFYMSDNPDSRQAESRFAIIDNATILKAARAVRISVDGMDTRRLLFERILPFIALELKLPKNAGYADILQAMLENRAERSQINRMKIYNYSTFFALVRTTPPKQVAKSTLLNISPDVAVDLLIDDM